jgi:hypothetical protein
VGAVLFLNGIWLLGKIGDNEISVINILTGTITLFIALYLAFNPAADLASIRATALTLLFTCTYYWVALNRYNGADGRGLGWFSIFVAITAVPVSIDLLQSANSTWGVWFGLSWVMWAFVWFLFFLLLAMQKPIAKLAGIATVLAGIFTGWLPGYLLLQGIIS